MKLKKFKQKSIFNIFKSANVQELGNPIIVRAWMEDMAMSKENLDSGKENALLSDYFKYDVTKNIITNNDLDFNQKLSAINKELNTCHEKVRKSSMFSITQKIAFWVLPVFAGGTLGACFGSILGTRLAYEIKRSALESQMADATAQDFLIALNDLKAEMRNELFNQLMIGEGCILAFCLIVGVLYKIYCSPILDRINDLESAKNVVQFLDNYKFKD